MYGWTGGSRVEGQVDPELASAIHRLAAVREQRHALETEEAMLRDLILRHVEHWPSDAFPLRVDAVELRRQIRPGRVDEEAALAVLDEAGLLNAAPRRYIVHPDGVADLPARLDALRLGAKKRQLLDEALARAVSAEPHADPDFLETAARRGQLTPAQYRACFVHGRPHIVVLTVR
jgi:hypothetical protein